MGVLEIARSDVVTVSPDDSIYSVAVKMSEENIGSVVVTEENSPVGIITDRDIAIDTIVENKDPSNTTAKEIMSEDPFTVDQDEGVFDVLNEMCNMGVRRIPVVDITTNELKGIITFDDFVWILSTELGNLSTIIEKESPPPE